MKKCLPAAADGGGQAEGDTVKNYAQMLTQRTYCLSIFYQHLSYTQRLGGANVFDLWEAHANTTQKEL